MSFVSLASVLELGYSRCIEIVSLFHHVHEILEFDSVDQPVSQDIISKQIPFVPERDRTCLRVRHQRIRLIHGTLRPARKVYSRPRVDLESCGKAKVLGVEECWTFEGGSAD